MKSEEVQSSTSSDVALRLFGQAILRLVEPLEAVDHKLLVQAKHLQHIRHRVVDN
jgi:hypothetical protein